MRRFGLPRADSMSLRDVSRCSSCMPASPPHHPLFSCRPRYRHMAVGESAAAPDLSDVREEPAHVYYY